MQLEIKIPAPMTTAKAVAWGERPKEMFISSQEAIRYAVQTCDGREQFRQWLETRTKLVLTVTFFLSPQRAAKSDMDSLLGDLFNPLVEGACGPRPSGKPIPQTKDALFWEVHASKISDSNERTEVTIRRLDAPPESPDAAALD